MTLSEAFAHNQAVFDTAFPRVWIPKFPRLEKLFPYLRRFGKYEYLKTPVPVSSRALRISLVLK